MKKTLEQLNKESEEYFATPGYPTEFDTSINVISEDKIKWAYDNWPQTWLGKINLYGDVATEKILWQSRRGDLTENFGCDFAISRYDALLVKMIKTRHEANYTGTKDDAKWVNAIYERLKALGAIILTWV